MRIIIKNSFICFSLMCIFVFLFFSCANPSSSSSDEESSSSSDEESFNYNAIIAFSFLAANNSELSVDVDGLIYGAGKTIGLTVPSGTDVTDLIPTIIIAGSSISPASDVTTDFTDPVAFTVTAEDGTTQDYIAKARVGVGSFYYYSEYSVGSVLFNMVDVPGGLTFPTGVDDTGTANVPNNFLIGQTEVTYELWETVYVWATDAARGTNQYTFANPGRQGGWRYNTGPFGTNQHPVTTINWRDAMVWTNALTEYYNEQNGTFLTCVYYTDANYSTPIRAASDSNVILYPINPGTQDNPFIKSDSTDNTDMANSTANGFRLLTSNEWGLAARYIRDDGDNHLDHEGEFYPGEFSSGADADSTKTSTNIDFDGDGDYQISSDVTVLHDDYSPITYTTNVTSKYPNALGLYDMSGNVWEWTHDEGPSSHFNGITRVVRGGYSLIYYEKYHPKLSAKWRHEPWYNRSTANESGNRPAFTGFRFARTP